MSDNEKSGLTIRDLQLLMDNYQNVVQLNTILLEQIKQLTDAQHQAMNKQDSIVLKQNQACERLNVVIEKLEGCSSNLQNTNDILKEGFRDVKTSFDEKMKDVNTEMTDHKVKAVERHSITNRNLYIAMGGTATVIVALVTLLVTVFQRFESLGDVKEMVNQIIVYFNI